MSIMELSNSQNRHCVCAISTIRALSAFVPDRLETHGDNCLGKSQMDVCAEF